MDEAFGYLILAGIVIAAIIAAIVALFYIGLLIIAGIAIAGAVAGCVVALKNFFAVLEEAHTAVPGPPGTSRRLYLTFAGAFVVVLALVAVAVLRQLAGSQPSSIVTGLPGVAASENVSPGTGRSAVVSAETRWSGSFDQGGQKTPFEAVIQSRAGSINGTIQEPAGQGRATQATLSGTVTGTSIAFQKRYPNGRVVSYSGTFASAGNAASGRWSVDSLQGTWTMTRSVESVGHGSGSGPALGPSSMGVDGGTGGAYRPGSGVTVPVVVREVKPQYTADAMRAKVEGAVRLECVVLPDGTVGDVRVTQSLDPVFGLDQEAIRAAKMWRFRPGVRQGEPVPVIVTIELTFKLR